jgi:hypothetical protein
MRLGKEHDAVLARIANEHPQIANVIDSPEGKAILQPYLN